MAFHGIRQCYEDPDLWFGGIICTGGGGSPRSGKYTSYSDEEMKQLRKKEQEKAAVLGKYSFVMQLDYPSSSVKDPQQQQLEEELAALLSDLNPQVVYTHNPADKHETHVGIFASVIHAIRRLPIRQRPGTVYGCEVWRDLDWMMDEDKIILEVHDEDGLGKRLIDVFDSQVEGGKRYDLAALGRRFANATFFQAHQTDASEEVVFAMDLTPLIAEDPPDILDYVLTHTRRFQQDVESKLKKRLGGTK
jgi:LmbE family N-acetylglucosaminyl deacetylase